ncbi:aminotransferase class I/II-fold pyridoxal phosphate-dependent enzyme [Legionella clemsonensis]|uniref:CAI-1 autoinducer synthase n=1 Tax=Legionella clemsonensis TaxID=1867846 RepID=A0A222P2X7_9GAMM|nr:aminotransferase class I/II-fold pyridoxal phosphate-dependent enzyme [Legionella clemsonensis]ASQ46177.1 CAI-1 autoinducer synthase [Legionella clemsonensis]
MSDKKPYVKQMEELFNRYRHTRTKERKGIIDYLLTQPAPTEKTILLNHNDYLGLACHPKVIEAQINSLSKEKNKIMMSGVFLSAGSYQFDMEQKLANYLGKEKGCIFQSGLCANISVTEAITDANIPVYIDQRAHASLWFGLRFTRAKIIPFRHNDVDDLENKIFKYGAGPIFIDSVYSAQGTMAPLVQIVQIKKAHHCFLVVDESHSLGLFGNKGSGLVAQLNLTSEVDCITASLSKSFCTRAGLVCGSDDFILFMKEKSTSMIFSSAVPNYDIARMEAMLHILTAEEGDALRARLYLLSAKLRQCLIEEKYRLYTEDNRSPIVSIFCGEEKDCRCLRLAFDSKNIYLSPFFQPATPPKETLLRMTVNSGISTMQLEYIAETVRHIKKIFLLQKMAHPAFEF